MGPLSNKDNSGFDNLCFDKFIIFGDIVFFCIYCMGFMGFFYFSVGTWDVGHTLCLCHYYYIYYYLLFLLFLNYYQCYGDQYDYFLYFISLECFFLSFNDFLSNGIDLCIAFGSELNPLFFKLLFNYF